MTNKDGIMMKNKQLLGSFFKGILSTVSVFSLLLLTMVNVSAADLQTVEYSSLSGDKAQITVRFSESIELPNSFSIDDPARIVL
ncbi:MAG: type IV pilus secretin PilQ, partial [Proteobacteria bacterium]|nr:type IV pilus secretin PilQ [Pseudomonadota bacterium]